MKLSVIIVNYNVKYFLEQCLHSVIKASTNIPAEIIVVDNSSVDGSSQMVQQRFPEVKLIHNDKNLGFAKANNQAIKESSGQFVLLLNPDTIVEEDTFDKVVAFMDEHEDAGGLGVMMVDGHGNFLPESKRGLPTPSVAFYKIFGLSTLFPKSKKFGQYHLGYLDKNDTHQVDVLSGAFMLLRREVLDKIGLLDEDFFMYGEDIDLSYRITKAGYKNYYFPKTRIIHYKGESTRKSSINYVMVFYRAMVIFARKHFNEKHARSFSALINIAIWLSASVSIINRFLQRILLPSLDFFGILLGLYLIRSNYTAFAGIEYNDRLINIAFPLYALVWTFCVFLSGGYEKPIRIKKLIIGLLIGTGLILAAYALLDEQYRFSRALILLGFAWSVVCALTVRFILHLIGLKRFKIGQRINQRFAVVGDEEERARVIKLLKESQERVDFVAEVNSGETRTSQQAKFVAGLNQLRELIGIFEVDVVIFCAKSIQANEIINQMSFIGKPDVEYKIVPPESAFIIGSNSIQTSGELYYIKDINSIDKPSNKRKKRLLDMMVSLIALPFLPILIFLVKKPFGLLANVFSVLLGNKTWVGFYASAANLSQLPAIKRGVLNPQGSAQQETDFQKASKENVLYARNYNVWKDLSLITQGVRYLGST